MRDRRWLVVAGLGALALAAAVGVSRGGDNPPAAGGPAQRPLKSVTLDPLALTLGVDVGLPPKLSSPPTAKPTVTAGVTLSSAPARGVVWRLVAAPVPRSLVAALAQTLGLHATPVHVGQGWTVRSGQAVLRVFETPGDRWAYDRTPYDVTCPSSPTSGDDPYAEATCAIGPGVLFDKRYESVSRGRQTLAPLVDLLHLPPPTVSASGWATVVTVAPLFHGQRTYGIGTWASINRTGFTSAYGWLGPVVEGGLKAVGTYPLVSPKLAFESLATATSCGRVQVQVQGRVPAPSATGTPRPVPCRVYQQVTAASKGLVLAYDGSKPDLVPVWAFTEEHVSPYPKQPHTNLQLAVDPNLVSRPAVPVPAQLLPPGPTVLP